MPVGFYSSYSSSDSQKFKITQGTQLLGVQDTPFFHNLKAISPDTSLPGVATAGIKWAYTIIPKEATENAHLEGGEWAKSEYWNATHHGNHFQIFQKIYSVTRSALKDSLEGLDRQRTLAQIALRKDINKALITNAAAVQRTATVPGKLGGLYSFLNNTNEIDAKNKPLSYDMIEDALSITSAEGIEMDTCYGNGRILREINKMMQENKRGSEGGNALIGMNYDKMTNLSNTSHDIRIIKDNMFAENELVFISQNNFAVVLFDELNKDLPATKDAIEKALIFELSLWCDNPFSCVRIKNIKTTAPVVAPVVGAGG